MVETLQYDESTTQHATMNAKQRQRKRQEKHEENGYGPRHCKHLNLIIVCLVYLFKCLFHGAHSQTDARTHTRERASRPCLCLIACVRYQKQIENMNINHRSQEEKDEKKQ